MKITVIGAGAIGGALRERIKVCELEAEAIQQALLVAAIAVPEGAGGPAVTADNMSRYIRELGIAPAADDTAALADVLRGCHPELPPLDAVRLLSN